MATLLTLPDPSPTGALRRFLGRPSVYLLVILAAQLMVVLDGTIVNVALPHIQQSLHFSGSGLSWVLNIYVLAFGGLLLLGARSGDLLGRRRVFLIGLALFTLASMAGGLATSAAMLLGARAVQGVGAALAAPSALSLLTSAFPEGAARIRALAMYTAVSAAGGAIGLVSGGLLTELVSWRWVMFVNVPIGLVVGLVAREVVVETPVREGRFDLLGALTSTLGMGGLVLGLVEAGARGWSSALTLVPLVAGAVLLVAFVRVESRAAEPIVPLRLLAGATRSSANATRGLVYAGMFGVFFFLTQFLQEVQGYSPLRAGLSFLPLPVSIFAASQLASRVLVKRFAPRTIILYGVALVGVALLVASRISVGWSYADIVPILVLLGVGAGVSFVTLTTLSLEGVAPADAGAASGLVNVSQQLGAALGLAVLVNVFGVATNHAQFTGSSDPATAARLVGTLVHGMHVAYAVGSLFAVAAFALVALTGRAGPSDADYDLPYDDGVLCEAA
jgi:EmrB/QacA subfamily drug resistance transporter